MSVDFSKLTPAPWIARDSRHERSDYCLHGSDELYGLKPNEVGWDILGDGPEDEPTEGHAVVYGIAGDGTIIPERADLEFIALSRNAFDVMMRRGWTAIPMRRGDELWWSVRLKDGSDMDLKFIVNSPSRGLFSDPFTALVEADKWYRENAK